MTRPATMIVVMEYDEEAARVIVRGVWPDDALSFTPPVPLKPGNVQNTVRVFQGIAMNVPTFGGLYPKKEE